MYGIVNEKWTSEHTKMWIHEVYLKLEMYDSYLNDMVAWCEDNAIESEPTVMVLSFLTILWVSYQLGEPISRQQIAELMGIKEWESFKDEICTLPPRYGELDHQALMQIAAKADIDI